MTRTPLAPRLAAPLAALLLACSGPGTGAADMSQPPGDAAVPVPKTLVVNEVFPHGADELTDPDWAELKNVSDSEIDLSGYKVRDDTTSADLPAGTRLKPGAYLVILCDDVPDGAATGSIHVPFKLGGGDEFRVVRGDGSTADSVVWVKGTVPDGKSWGRLPDGTGQFAATTPTRGARNL